MRYYGPWITAKKTKVEKKTYSNRHLTRRSEPRISVMFEIRAQTMFGSTDRLSHTEILGHTTNTYCCQRCWFLSLSQWRLHRYTRQMRLVPFYYIFQNENGKLIVLNFPFTEEKFGHWKRSTVMMRTRRTMYWRLQLGSHCRCLCCFCCRKGRAAAQTTTRRINKKKKKTKSKKLAHFFPRSGWYLDVVYINMLSMNPHTHGAHTNCVLFSIRDWNDTICELL